MTRPPDSSEKQPDLSVDSPLPIAVAGFAFGKAAK
jgi:hypothetical protein